MREIPEGGPRRCVTVPTTGDDDAITFVERFETLTA